jgi:hypothetical protein
MAKRKAARKGVTNPKDLHGVRKQIDARHAKPAARSRGVTKSAVNRTLKVIKYDWTPERDDTLRREFIAPTSSIPHGLIANLATKIGYPFHIVKRRAKFLGLLPGKGKHLTVAAPAPDTCKHGTPTVAGSRCADCAEDADRQMRETDAERVEAEKPAKRERKPVVVMCPQGDERLEIMRRGKRGFTIVGGAAPEKIYGAGPNGLPICPTHDVEMLAAELVEVAEAFRQAKAAAEPPAQSALFDTAKEFNADGALVALDGLREQIFALRDVVAKESREVATHKKQLDTLEESLFSGLEEFMKRRRAKAATVAEHREREQVRESAVCSFERHVGKDCLICHAVSRALAIANLDATITAYTDVTSEAHRAAAVKANSIDPGRLTNAGPSIGARALEIAGLYGVTPDDVSTWTDEDRIDALRWLESDQTETPPDVLGVPHRAAAPGTESQCCVDCGAQLQAMADAREAFPEGALVGLHCTRDLHAAPETAEPSAMAASA